MMKPGIGSYDRFKELFDKYSKEAGKEQYLIPYFIAAHPGTTDEDMLEPGAVAQAQRLPRRPGAGLPAVADGDRDRDVPHGQEPAAQGHARQRDGGHRARRQAPRACTRRSCAITTPNNWPLLREALKAMGRADLIGNGKHQLIPTCQPLTDGSYQSARRKNSTPWPAQPAAPARPHPDPAHRPAAACQRWR